MFPVAEGDFLETFTIMSSFRGPNSLHALGKLQWFANKGSNTWEWFLLPPTIMWCEFYPQKPMSLGPKSNMDTLKDCHVRRRFSFQTKGIWGTILHFFFVNYSLIKLQNCCITSLDDTKWYNHHPSKADQSSLFRKTHHHTARKTCGGVLGGPMGVGKGGSCDPVMGVGKGHQLRRWWRFWIHKHHLNYGVW